MRPLLALLALAACADPLADDGPLVSRQRLVAVVAEPPEARPGERVTLTALTAGPEGLLASTAAAWTVCRTPKAPAENGTAAPDCQAGAGEPAGSGVVRASIPPDACARFGPVAPPGGLRPRDPDGSGGWYQPFGARDGDDLAIALVRLRCPLPLATLEVARAFEERYRVNENPAPPTVALDCGPARDGSRPLTLRARCRVRAALPEAASEPFVAWDPGSLDLAERRELLTVSWYATVGRLAAARAAARDEVEWTAPADEGPFALFAVVRDDRGGVSAGLLRGWVSR